MKHRILLERLYASPLYRKLQRKLYDPMLRKAVQWKLRCLTAKVELRSVSK